MIMLSIQSTREPVIILSSSANPSYWLVYFHKWIYIESKIDTFQLDIVREKKTWVIEKSNELSTSVFDFKKTLEEEAQKYKVAPEEMLMKHIQSTSEQLSTQLQSLREKGQNVGCSILESIIYFLFSRFSVMELRLTPPLTTWRTWRRTSQMLRMFTKSATRYLKFILKKVYLNKYSYRFWTRDVNGSPSFQPGRLAFWFVNKPNSNFSSQSPLYYL